VKLPTPAGVEAAASALAGHLAPTPLVRCELISRQTGADVFIKNETVSPVASFKLRGALTALLRARGRGALRRVVTSSTGNHGQGVAYAARMLGLAAHVFMPEIANPTKQAMIEAFGARVHQVGRDLDASKELAIGFAHEQSALFVDDGESCDVMEGAGSVGLEIAGELEPDVVFVPMGSGTLAAGCGVAIKARCPATRVIAVQAKGAPAMVESFRARAPIERPAETAADGLVCRVPARLALSALLAGVDDAMLVSDDALLRGVRVMAEQAHLLVEPAGAAGLAALSERSSELSGQRVVIVATGSNLTPDLLRRAVATV